MRRYKGYALSLNATHSLIMSLTQTHPMVPGSMHPGEAGLVMGNIDAWCIEVPPLDELGPDTYDGALAQ